MKVAVAPGGDTAWNLEAEVDENTGRTGSGDDGQDSVAADATPGIRQELHPKEDMTTDRATGLFCVFFFVCD